MLPLGCSLPSARANTIVVGSAGLGTDQDRNNGSARRQLRSRQNWRALESSHRDGVCTAFDTGRCNSTDDRVMHIHLRTQDGLRALGLNPRGAFDIRGGQFEVYLAGTLPTAVFFSPDFGRSSYPLSGSSRKKSRWRELVGIVASFCSAWPVLR